MSDLFKRKTKKEVRTLIDEVDVVDGKPITLHGLCLKLQEIAAAIRDENGNPDVTLALETYYIDGAVESFDIDIVYDRPETDKEYNERMARERRERSTIALTIWKRELDIEKLQQEAKRLGFILCNETCLEDKE